MSKFLKLKYTLIIVVFFLVTSGFCQEIEQSIYVTGNTWDTNNTEVLAQIVEDSKTAQNPTLLILGNATPRTGFKNALKKQLSVVKELGKHVIFMPGNHEWSANGHRGVSDIEKYIQKNSKAKFYPDDTEPIKHHDLGENTVLITVDSQWFLEDWNKDTYINDDTEIQNRTLFFLEFENRIKKAQGKIILVAIHHPIETKTRQGFFGNVGGFSQQDFQNKQFRKLRNRLKTIARGTDHIIFISGHDKNLQFINDAVPQIISGAAGSLQNVKNTDDDSFATAKNGYARLDIDNDGKVTVQFYTFQNGTSKAIFQSTVLKGHKDEKTPSYRLNDNFPWLSSNLDMCYLYLK